MDNWMSHASRLAGELTYHGLHWQRLVAETPRHLLVPRWWSREGDEWVLHDGPSDEGDWLRAAYVNKSLVTEVGGLHADKAVPGQQPPEFGRPTSSSALPGLVVRMLRHAHIEPGMDVLDVGTGSAYGTALACKIAGDEHVTSIDVDPYVIRAAATRLAGMGLNPVLYDLDATSACFPYAVDRIVAMTSVRPVPRVWLQALRPGGRLVTTIAGTGLILTANRTGGEWAAVGRIEWDRAMFMSARDVPGSGTTWCRVIPLVEDLAGGQPERGRYPVINILNSWELLSLIEIAAPGTEHAYEEDADGRRTAWMLNPDGSWARATAKDKHAVPEVLQGGPRRLWDLLDGYREDWLTAGYLQLYGAKAFIQHDGVIRLSRGGWEVTIE